MQLAQVIPVLRGRTVSECQALDPLLLSSLKRECQFHHHLKNILALHEQDRCIS